MAKLPIARVWAIAKIKPPRFHGQVIETKFIAGHSGCEKSFALVEVESVEPPARTPAHVACPPRWWPSRAAVLTAKAWIWA